MSDNTFAEELRIAYRGIEACLSAGERELVARARDPINTGGAERNWLLAEAVCAYRRGPKQLWGPVLLDLLAPNLVVILQGLRTVPPAIDEEEIRQQLVAEVLRAAAIVPLQERGRQTRFRLISRTYTSMLRWLDKEGRRRRSQVPFEAWREWRR